MERRAGRGFHKHEAVIIEVGEAGCFVRTTRRPVEGERIGLQIQDPKDDNNKLRFFGIVEQRTGRDATEAGFSLEFETATAVDRAHLNKIVERLRNTLKSGGFREHAAEEASKATFNRPRVDVEEAEHARLTKTGSSRAKKTVY